MTETFARICDAKAGDDWLKVNRFAGVQPAILAVGTRRDRIRVAQLGGCVRHGVACAGAA